MVPGLVLAKGAMLVGQRPELVMELWNQQHHVSKNSVKSNSATTCSVHISVGYNMNSLYHMSALKTIQMHTGVACYM